MDDPFASPAPTSSGNSQQTNAAAMKAESMQLEGRIQTALTQDEALQLALEAAELCIQAIQLATDSRQRTEIRLRCQSLMDKAESIKVDNDWKPLLSLTPTASSPLVPQSECTNSQPETNDTLLDFEDLTFLETDKPSHLPRSAAVKRLSEPVCTRQFTRSEQILLLRGSKLNGSQFPPWKEAPNDRVFSPLDGEEPFVDKPTLRLSSRQLSSFDGWRRAHVALPPPSWAPDARINVTATMRNSQPLDLVQDAATDCSVVASLCAVAARAEKGHANILAGNFFPWNAEWMGPQLSPNGKYVLRLNFNGCYRKVVIDDRLPVSKTQRLLHVIDRKSPGLLWPALLEKAYLKVRGGYDFPGSNSSTDLWILTGWLPEQIFLQDDTTEPDQEWKRMLNAFQYGDVLVTMGTGKMSPHLERELGLAGQHDYAVLEMREQESQKLVLLKNPWCEGPHWRGSALQTPFAEDTLRARRRSLGSCSAPSSATSTPKTRLSIVGEYTDGTFWIDWNNVLQHFESIYLNWNPGLFSHRQDLHFSWDLSQKRSAVGSFVENPQFAVSCSEGGTLWLVLCRHFKDTEEQSSQLLHNDNVEPSGEFFGHISLYVYDRKGQRIHISASPVKRGRYVDSPQTLLKMELPARTAYTVVVSEQDLPTVNHTFSLMAFSTMHVDLDKARDRYSFHSLMESQWTSATGGGGAHVVTYSSNPQFSLDIPNKTPIALLLETPSSNLHVHVKLVHGDGKRVSHLSKKDIIMDSGEYRRGSAFAEQQEIDAGRYTIICSTFEPGQTASFTLRVDTFVQAQLKQLAGEFAGRLSMALSTVCFSGDSSKMAAPIYPRRLLKFMAEAKFRGGNGYVAASGGSPVRISVELGRGPSRRMLAVSSDGEYLEADGGGIRTSELDIWPQMLQHGDMWLVLERMASPAMPGEERFGVQVWCDSKPEDGMQVGVWRGWDD